MKGVRNQRRGHALVEVLVAMLLSAVVLTIFFSLDTGIRRAISGSLSRNYDYTALLLLRRQLTADIVNSQRYRLLNESTLTILHYPGDTVKYQIHRGQLLRNGITTSRTDFAVINFALLYPTRKFNADPANSAESLLVLTLAKPGIDSLALRFPLNPINGLKVRWR